MAIGNNMALFYQKKKKSNIVRAKANPKFFSQDPISWLCFTKDSFS